MNDDERIIGVTSGLFDKLDSVDCLNIADAKTQCDYLIVALKVDRGFSGAFARAKQTVYERKVVLESIRYIDDVEVYETDEDLYNFLSRLSVRYGQRLLMIVDDSYKGRDFIGDDIEGNVHYQENRYRKRKGDSDGEKTSTRLSDSQKNDRPDSPQEQEQ
jgi:glycerol-3-phosphate cytidylyltransferase